MRNQGNVGKRNTESLRIFVVFLLPLKVTQPLHYTLSQALLFSATKLCSNLRIGASTNNLGCKWMPTKKWRGIKSPISPKVGSSNDFRWSIDPCPNFQWSDKTPIHFRRSTQSFQFNCTASPHHFKELIDSKHSWQLTKNLHLEKVLICDKDKGLPQKIPGSRQLGKTAVVSGDVKPCVCLAHWQKDLTPASWPCRIQIVGTSFLFGFCKVARCAWNVLGSRNSPTVELWLRPDPDMKLGILGTERHLLVKWST